MKTASARRLLGSSTLIASHFLGISTSYSQAAFLPNHSTSSSWCSRHYLASQQQLKMSSQTEASSTLPYEKHSHNSVLIVVPEEGISGPFHDRLDATVQTLKKMGKSSVWVEVPMTQASLIEEMTDLGFEFHHANGKKARLNKWLPEKIPSKVPEFATQ